MTIETMTWGKDWAGRQLRWLWELFHWVATSAFLDQYRKGMILPARKKHRKTKKDVSFGNITILAIPNDCSEIVIFGMPPKTIFYSKWFWNILNIYKSLAYTVHHSSSQCPMSHDLCRFPATYQAVYFIQDGRGEEDVGGFLHENWRTVEGKIWI